jgi:hypothetical protein
MQEASGSAISLGDPHDFLRDAAPEVVNDATRVNVTITALADVLRSLGSLTPAEAPFDVVINSPVTSPQVWCTDSGDTTQVCLFPAAMPPDRIWVPFSVTASEIEITNLSMATGL